MSPPDEFQTVMIIAPEPGSNCRALSARVIGADNENEANERREILLRVDVGVKSTVIRCTSKDGLVRRRMPRLLMPRYVTRTQVIRGEEVERRIFRGAGAFPPIFHVPAPDEQAAARWDAWEAEACREPMSAGVRHVCTEGLEMARSADLGGQR